MNHKGRKGKLVAKEAQEAVAKGSAEWWPLASCSAFLADSATMSQSGECTFDHLPGSGVQLNHEWFEAGVRDAAWRMDFFWELSSILITPASQVDEEAPEYHPPQQIRGQETSNGFTTLKCGLTLFSTRPLAMKSYRTATHRSWGKKPLRFKETVFKAIMTLTKAYRKPQRDGKSVA